MLQKIKQRNEGFTIIEVLIVLAIAGLIMLIVFLAVPALQRNSRNTRKRDDVGKALSATNDWVTNNSGKLISSLAAADLTTAETDITNNSALSSGTSIQLRKAKTDIAAGDVDKIQIVSGVTCSGSGVLTAAAIADTQMQALVTPGAARSVAAVYVLEASGGLTAQCQGS